MKLEDLEVFKQSMELADRIWKLIERWDYFNKDTIGKQLIRSIDSIGANISEGFGRYHYKDRMRFSYYSRGSLFESKAWILIARNRGLIEVHMADQILLEPNDLSARLNNYIISTGRQNNSK